MIKRVSILIIFSIFSVFTLFSLSFAEGTLTIHSPTYFEDQANVFEDINYLENELFSFSFCTTEKPTNTKATLTCSDKKEIELDMFRDYSEENCFYSNRNFDNISCDDFELKVEFTENGKDQQILRSFTSKRESKVTSYVISSVIETLDPLSLSYYINVLSKIETINGENTVAAYEQLKNLRSNSNKCWPSNGCDMTTTTEILINLMKAGYSLETRILEDGETYIEQRTFNNNNSPLVFLIDADGTFFDNQSNEVNCTLILDDEEGDNYTLERNDQTIQTTVVESIDFSCDAKIEDLDFVLYDVDGEVLEEEEYINQTGFTYSVDQFACIGEDNECSYVDSIQTLITYTDTIDDNDLIENYVETFIEVEEDGETYINTGNRFEDGGKFLLYKNNEPLLEFLKFKQNNDGSWGSGSDQTVLEQTAWAILGIKKQDSNAENVADGQDWIYFEEPLTGWGSVKKNSLAYLAIQENIKPYVKVSTINELKENQEITVENPSIFDIKDVTVTLGDKILDNVLYTASLGNIESGNSVAFNATVKADFKDEATDKVTVTGVDINDREIILLEFPLSIVGKAQRFTIESKNVTNSIDDTLIELNTGNHNGATFTCTYVDPFNASVNTLNVSEGTVISLNNSDLKSGEFSFDLACTTEEDEFTLPVSIGTEVVVKTFETDLPEIVMDVYRDVTLFVTSTSEEDQEVTVEVTETYGGILVPTEQEFTLRAGAEKRLRFLMGDTSFLELLDDNQIRGDILLTAENYAKAVPINREQEIFESNTTEDEGSGIWGIITIIIIIIVLGFIGLVGFRVYEMRKLHEQQEKEKEQQQNQNQDDEMYIDL